MGFCLFACLFVVVVVVVHSCFIARWLGLPLELGQHFAVDAGAISILSYAHKNFNEPTIGALFSAQDGLHPPADQVDSGAEKLDAGNAPIGLPPTLVDSTLRTGAMRDRVLHCLNGRVVGSNPDAANPGERQYLALVQAVLDAGEKRADRTGHGTLAVFAPTP